MALKNVQRVTFSIPKTIIRKLEINIPKNKRSKFIAELIEKNLEKKETITLEEVSGFWDNIAKHYQPKIKKTAVELQREDRLSH
ncbi:MAG: hypothetical protein WC843_00995 [Candidatus Gracilibacteria bacterium]|jgi:metal-responsive CopG/Arc/MetJ family transcriptional regulator